MKHGEFKIPFYAKAAFVFICVYAFVYTLRIGQHILVPIIYATLIAILLNPLINFLVRKKLNRIIAISIAVFLAVVLVLSVLYVITTQFYIFNEFYPKIKIKFGETSAGAAQWVSQKFNISELKINTWVKETEQEAVKSFAIGATILQVGRTTAALILLPVYLFMMLYYKELLLEFLRKLFTAENHKTVVEVLTNAKSIVQSYLVGLFFEMLIVAALNSTGLLLMGIDYAVILGITGALLNIIPYIGGIMAAAISVVIAFVTKDSYVYPLLVLCLYIFVQFIDNHFIVPRVVASRVKINALMSIVVVLIGGALWGIPGMFLSIPLTAILKVIFDHIEPLKPLGFLLGNMAPASSKLLFRKQNQQKDTRETI